MTAGKRHGMREADRPEPTSYAYAEMVSLAAVAGKDGSVCKTHIRG